MDLKRAFADKLKQQDGARAKTHGAGSKPLNPKGTRTGDQIDFGDDIVIDLSGITGMRTPEERAQFLAQVTEGLDAVKEVATAMWNFDNPADLTEYITGIPVERLDEIGPKIAGAFTVISWMLKLLSTVRKIHMVPGAIDKIRDPAEMARLREIGESLKDAIEEKTRQEGGETTS